MKRLRNGSICWEFKGTVVLKSKVNFKGYHKNQVVIWDFHGDKQSTKLISLKLECLHTSWLDHSRFSHSQLFLSILIGHLRVFLLKKRTFLFWIHLKRLLELRHIRAAALGVVRLAATLRRILVKNFKELGKKFTFPPITGSTDPHHSLALRPASIADLGQ